MTKVNDLDSSSKVVIGELTSIRVGLIIFIIASIVSSVWWAATITAKLDSILTNQAQTNTAVSELRVEISDIKTKLAIDEKDIQDLKNNHLIVPINGK